MPRRPLKPCRHPGCPNLTSERYCLEHEPMHRRPSAHERGYDSRWQRESKMFLREHPFCVGCGRPAKVVDHRTPHKGNKRLFWDKTNWQALCKCCHDTKTATEDGGFGRTVREYRYCDEDVIAELRDSKR